jgi:hypothetical protein
MNIEALANLSQFTCTDGYHRHSALFPNILHTDGVKHLCDNADCYWLLDIIGSYQPQCRGDSMLQDMQFWSLHKGASKKASEYLETSQGLLHFLKSPEGPAACHVVCERDTDDAAIVQNVPMTDFPFETLGSLKLYCQRNEGGKFVICLPSEY